MPISIQARSVNAARPNPPADRGGPSWTLEDGSALRSHRLVRGESQTDVGEFMKGQGARFGSQSLVSRVETGKQVPSGREAATLRAYLATPAEEERGRPTLRLLDELVGVQGPARPDHRVEDLTQILFDRLAGATGSITEYEWKTVQLLMQIYSSP
jgi:transcriptional regulator with XRE-family HTH domain